MDGLKNILKLKAGEYINENGYIIEGGDVITIDARKCVSVSLALLRAKEISRLGNVVKLLFAKKTYFLEYETVYGEI